MAESVERVSFLGEVDGKVTPSELGILPLTPATRAFAKRAKAKSRKSRLREKDAARNSKVLHACRAVHQSRYLAS